MACERQCWLLSRRIWLQEHDPWESLAGDACVIAKTMTKRPPSSMSGQPPRTRHKRRIARAITFKSECVLQSRDNGNLLLRPTTMTADGGPDNKSTFSTHQTRRQDDKRDDDHRWKLD